MEKVDKNLERACIISRNKRFLKGGSNDKKHYKPN